MNCRTARRRRVPASARPTRAEPAAHRGAAGAGSPSRGGARASACHGRADTGRIGGVARLRAQRDGPQAVRGASRIPVPAVMLPILLTGLFAGLVHVLAGPDHLAAVAPLALQRARRPWLVGALWGGGHTAGVLAVAALALLLRELLPLQALSSWSDRLVGVALIAIGLWGLRRALAHNVHVHRHTHGGLTHSHIHFHADAHAHEAPQAHAHAHVSFAMGTLHGLAGSAHVLGVLPALALPTLAGSLDYLAGFGTGSILAMGAVAWLLGASLRGLERAGLQPYRVLLTGCSGAAIVIGTAWLVL
jgi:hypothetical protein